MRILETLEELIDFTNSAPKWATGVAIGYIKFKASAEVEDRVNYLNYQRNLLLKDAIAKMVHTMFFFVDRLTPMQPEREEFNRMIEFYYRYTDSDNCPHLFVERTDRLSRRDEDFIKARDLVNKNGLVIHYVNEGSILSSNSSPDDDFILNVRKIIAEFYRSNISEEIKKGMKEKAIRGFYPSLAPIGYINKVDPEGNKTIIPDSRTAPLIKKMFEWLVYDHKSNAEIYSLVAKCGYVNPRTNSPLSRKTIYRILRRPIYAGYFYWCSERYVGTYKPLISHELFSKAQKVLDGS